jgi:hypothetical protein
VDAFAILSAPKPKIPTYGPKPLHRRNTREWKAEMFPPESIDKRNDRKRVLAQFQNNRAYTFETARTAGKLRKYISKSHALNLATAAAPDVISDNIHRPIEHKVETMNARPGESPAKAAHRAA